MKCNECPLSLLCYMGLFDDRDAHTRSYGVFLCPVCERLIHTRIRNNKLVVYTFYCEKRRMTSKIKHIFKNKGTWQMRIDDFFAGQKLVIMTCVPCTIKEEGELLDCSDIEHIALE